MLRGTSAGWDELRAALDAASAGDPDVLQTLETAASELAVRWAQARALVPLSSAHTGPTSFGAPYDLLIRLASALSLRFSPYLYTTIALQREYGWPPFTRVPSHDTAPAFLVGPALLVAPVVQPAVVQQSVHLPAGRWYDFWADTVHTGEHVLTVPAPLERLPLFVRAGATIPLLHSEAATHRLRVFAGDAENTLYEDGRNANDFAGGNYRWVYVTCRQSDDGLHLNRRVAGRYAPQATQQRLEVVGLTARPRDVQVDRRSAPVWYFEQGRLELTVPDDFSEVDIHI